MLLCDSRPFIQCGLSDGLYYYQESDDYMCLYLDVVSKGALTYAYLP